MTWSLDGWYAVLLDGWTSPADVWVCASEPDTERYRLESLRAFDDVRFISRQDYDTRDPGTSAPRTHTADGREYVGTVWRLVVRAVAEDRPLPLPNEPHV